VCGAEADFASDCIGSVGNKFEALLNGLSREKIKMNFVADRKNVWIPGSWHVTCVAWTWLRYKAEIATFFFSVAHRKIQGRRSPTFRSSNQHRSLTHCKFCCT